MVGVASPPAKGYRGRVRVSARELPPRSQFTALVYVPTANNSTLRFCSWPQLVHHADSIAAAAPSVTAESIDSTVGLLDFAAGTVIRCAAVQLG